MVLHAPIRYKSRRKVRKSLQLYRNTAAYVCLFLFLFIFFTYDLGIGEWRITTFIKMLLFASSRKHNSGLINKDNLLLLWLKSLSNSA